MIFPGERPLHALRERGVEYVEVRCMDLDPFVPVGIAAQTIRFLDVFLLHCLLSESPPDTPEEIVELARNQHRTAARGREPGLRLERGGKEVLLTAWAAGTGRMHTDRSGIGRSARRRKLPQRCRQRSPHRTSPIRFLPRVLDVMAKHYDNSYVHFVRTQSAQTKDGLLRLPFPADVEARFIALAQNRSNSRKVLRGGHDAVRTLPPGVPGDGTPQDSTESGLTF